MPLISAYSAVLAIIVLIVAARAFTERVRLKRANLSPYGGIKKLEGLLVVITGASSGIGEQLAYMYARKKCRLYLIALESALLDNVRENCLKLGAASCLAISSNLVREESLCELKELLGPLCVDVLHLNHGALENRLCLDYERGRNWDHFERVTKCNYESHVKLLSLLLGNMLVNKNGAAIAVTCSGGIAGPLPFDGAYVAAKSALCAYFANLRQELRLLGAHVTVTIMFPGAVETSFLAAHTGLVRNAVKPADLAKVFVRAVESGDEYAYFPRHVRAAFWLSFFAQRLYNFVVCSVAYVPHRPDISGRLNEGRETIKTKYTHDSVFD